MCLCHHFLYGNTIECELQKLLYEQIFELCLLEFFPYYLCTGKPCVYNLYACALREWAWPRPYFLKMSLWRDFISRRSTMWRQFEAAYTEINTRVHSFNEPRIMRVRTRLLLSTLYHAAIFRLLGCVG